MFTVGKRLISMLYMRVLPIPIAALSKSRVRGRSVAGIADSIPARGKYVCLL